MSVFDRAMHYAELETSAAHSKTPYLLQLALRGDVDALRALLQFAYEDGARREVTMINLDSGKQLLSELIRDWDQHLAHCTVAELTQ